MLLQEQFFPLRVDPIGKGSKNNGGVASPESVPIHLTVKTLNIGTPRLNTVAVLNIKQFNFTMK